MPTVYSKQKRKNMDKVAQDSVGLNSLLRSSQAAKVFMIMYVCLRADATYFSYYLPNIDWGNILDEGDDPGRLCHDDCRGTGRTRARNKQTPTIIPVRGHPSTPTVTAMRVQLLGHPPMEQLTPHPPRNPSRLPS